MTLAKNTFELYIARAKSQRIKERDIYASNTTLDDQVLTKDKHVAFVVYRCSTLVKLLFFMYDQKTNNKRITVNRLDVARAWPTVAIPYMDA